LLIRLYLLPPILAVTLMIVIAIHLQPILLADVLARLDL
jgi:hypothetical protein